MKRLFAILLTAALLLTLLPAAVVAAENEVTVGDFTIWATEGGTLTDSDYSFSDGRLAIKSATAVTVKNTDPDTATTNHIDVESENANITLAGVNIDVGTQYFLSAFRVTDKCTGTVTVTLADNTVNTLTGSLDCAGLQKDSSGYLIIQGDTLGTGSLIATGGGLAAGIGGSAGRPGSKIIIKGGTVVAQGGDLGAGIGGGRSADGGDITISGGTVTAQGGNLAAGIGGGFAADDVDDAFNITISGGSVRAIAGKNANAVGSGLDGNGPVTPQNKVSDGEDVYLLTIANPDSEPVTIDGTQYTPVNHVAADGTDTNLYVYLTGEHHTVQVGDDFTCYHYVNGQIVQCQLGDTPEKDTEGHWYLCTEDTCTEIHSYVAHNWSEWIPQEGGKHIRSCQTQGCTQRETGDCADKDQDHDCDDCGRELPKHTGGQATCTVQAVCSICGRSYGDLLRCKSIGYSDIGGKEWFHDDVDYVIEKGLMQGYGNGTFRPWEPLTRAELVQILYNWAGKPQVEITDRFSDVKTGIWYSEAVSWAYEKGIVNGMGDGTFGPNLPITREQLATMLYREAGEPETSGTLKDFADGNQASDYAVPALKWAVEQGILQGDQNEAGETCLRPQDDAKRGEVAAMLHRYIG